MKGTINLGLKYTGVGEKLTVKTDSSFFDWSDSTSTGGYIMELYGDPVAWRSYKQGEVTTSTCKAEYRAMSDACKEIISMDKGVREIINDTCLPADLWCDNEAAVKNTQMEGCHKICDFDDDMETIRKNLKFREVNGKRAEMSDKHGDYVKYLAKKGKVIVRWLSTKENTADIFTKPLERESHRRFTNDIIKSK